MVLFIDNYDSFTYNLVQYAGEVIKDIKVFRNDEVTIDKISELNPTHIIISPGPGKPIDSGISINVIKKFYKTTPILGVCLGHQAIGQAFGGLIIHAPEIVHGKLSLIYHDELDIFKDIKSPFKATRYHSLIIKASTLPEDLKVIAKTQDELVMAIKHKDYNLFGVQFHPESFLTEDGKTIIKNFLNIW